MKLRTKIMSAVAVLLLTASCSPGLGRENPVPNPNPDHGAEQPGHEAPTREVVFHIDIMAAGFNEYANNRLVTGTVSCSQANGKPAWMVGQDGRVVPFVVDFRARTNYEGMANTVENIGKGGVEVRLKYSPGVARCSILALIQGDAGETAFLDILTGEIGFRLINGVQRLLEFGAPQECTIPEGGSGCSLSGDVVLGG